MQSFIPFLLAQATQQDINGDVKSFSIRAIGVAALVLVVLLAVAAVTVKNKRYHSLKTPLFVAIASTIILPSLLLVASTVYVNVKSESNGPVHWHTDIEFWVCDQEIELRDPYEFLSNKVGTSTYHEHDDKRIHLEGVVFEKEYDASLGKFMTVTDGDITPESLVIPTDPQIFENDTDGDKPTGNEQDVRDFVLNDIDDSKPAVFVQNGDTCGSSQEPGEVQAFLMRYDGSSETYEQTKLESPKDYVMRDESLVPPGDCLIVEFGPSKNYTDRLCEQYGVRDAERCMEFGVPENNGDLCSLRQTRSDSSNDEPQASEINEESPEDCEKAGIGPGGLAPAACRNGETEGGEN